MESKEQSNIPALDADQLAVALRNGDERAFDELVRRLQGNVFAVAYRMTGNREDALDVAQETFIKVYRKIHMWRPTGGFIPWLMRLTTNQSIDLLRRRKRRRQEVFDDRCMCETAGSASAPGTMDAERSAWAGEIDVRVQTALETLSPSQRSVFVLRHYEGMALAEIAKALGCTVGSVKVHLFRGLKKLQRELKDLHEGPGRPGE